LGKTFWYISKIVIPSMPKITAPIKEITAKKLFKPAKYKINGTNIVITQAACLEKFKS